MFFSHLSGENQLSLVRFGLVAVSVDKPDIRGTIGCDREPMCEFSRACARVVPGRLSGDDRDIGHLAAALIRRARL